MAVEPREIKQPTETASASIDEVEAGTGENASDAAEKKKGLPIIPILAGLVALIVLVLLGKVVFSK